MFTWSTREDLSVVRAKRSICRRISVTEPERRQGDELAIWGSESFGLLELELGYDRSKRTWALLYMICVKVDLNPGSSTSWPFIHLLYPLVPELKVPVVSWNLPQLSSRPVLIKIFDCWATFHFKFWQRGRSSSQRPSSSCMLVILWTK